MAAKNTQQKFIEVEARHVKQRAWSLYSFILDSAKFDRIAFVSVPPISRITSIRRMAASPIASL
jgi:hypothetical protein